ncbi:MAG: sulfatase-like hydrolase/transferase, partial [Planctomycetota bacterium]
LHRELDSLKQSLEGLKESLTAFQQEMRASITSTSDRIDRFRTETEEAIFSLRAFLSQTADRVSGLHQILEGMKESAGKSPPAGIDEIASFDYFSFENQLRGREEEIKERQLKYLPYFQGKGNVIDIGCGRGEFLEICKEEGIPAKGVDGNEGMVARCREKGLAVERAEGLTYLETLPDASLGGIFCAQVIEHLPVRVLGRFVETCQRKLKVGGVAVFETVNPHCELAFRMFFADPTHEKPVFPEFLKILMEGAGFREIEMLFSSLVPGKEEDEVPEHDRHLWNMDYACIGSNQANSILRIQRSSRSCESQEALGAPKNIFLVCIDDLRFDCLGCEDNKELLNPYQVAGLIETRVLDRIAASGVRFSQAISHSSYTTASHASVFTGLTPPRHGVREFFKSTLYEGVSTLSEILSKAGYSTTSAVDFELLYQIGLDRGLDKTLSLDARFSDLIERRFTGRNFFFFHFSDVHEPYGFAGTNLDKDPEYISLITNLRIKKGLDDRLACKHKPTCGCELRAIVDRMFRDGEIAEIFSLYIEGVNRFDAGRFNQFTRALQAGGFLEDSLLVIFSDHGEAPCAENFCHAGELLDGIIRVPLIFSAPGRLPKGKVARNQVRLIDIFPTILDICGIEPDLKYSIDGKSLLPLVNGMDEAEREAYSEVWSRRLPSAVKSESDDDSTMIQKSLRYSGMKAVECGHDFPESPIPLDGLSDEDFIKHLYMSILRRVEDPEGFNNYTKKLSEKELTRNEIADILRNSKEGKNIRRLFDLHKDPFERENLLLSEADSEKYEGIFEKMHKRMKEICLEGDSLEGKRVDFQDEDTRKKVIHQLKSLGYFE